jgi:adenosylhomocysteine nucleosidase
MEKKILRACWCRKLKIVSQNFEDLTMKKLCRNNSGIWVITATNGEFNHPSANIIYSGIGKVNAAAATQHIIDTENPKLILSLATAGSSNFDFGDIINCTSFVQRDMNTTEFMAPKFVVPMTNDPQIFEYGNRDEKYKSGICGSGDTFVRTIAADIWNCVDMEAFATAYLCRNAGISFACYKFITDGKNANTQDHEWSDVLSAASTALNKLYDEIVVGL